MPTIGEGYNQQMGPRHHSGYKLELVGKPVQSHQPTAVLQQDNMAQMNREIESMLDKRAVVEVNHPIEGFIPPCF